MRRNRINTDVLFYLTAECQMDSDPAQEAYNAFTSALRRIAKSASNDDAEEIDNLLHLMLGEYEKQGFSRGFSMAEELLSGRPVRA